MQNSRVQLNRASAAWFDDSTRALVSTDHIYVLSDPNAVLQVPNVANG